MFKLLTPVNDHDRFSLYYINTISSIEVMRIQKISARGLFVDPISNLCTNVMRIV